MGKLFYTTRKRIIPTQKLNESFNPIYLKIDYKYVIYLKIYLPIEGIEDMMEL